MATLAGFLEAFVHHALYARSVYPREYFSLEGLMGADSSSRKEEVQYFRCRHPLVEGYVFDHLKALVPCVANVRVVRVITGVGEAVVLDIPQNTAREGVVRLGDVVGVFARLSQGFPTEPSEKRFPTHAAAFELGIEMECNVPPQGPQGEEGRLWLSQGRDELPRMCAVLSLGTGRNGDQGQPPPPKIRPLWTSPVLQMCLVTS